MKVILPLSGSNEGEVISSKSPYQSLSAKNRMLYSSSTGLKNWKLAPRVGFEPTACRLTAE